MGAVRTIGVLVETGQVMRGTGLTSAEAADRLARHGPNTVTARRPVGLARRVGGQLADPLIVVLLLAAALTLVTGDRADCLIILVVVVANTAVGVVQELRADAAIAALCAMSAPTARVRRDGAVRLLPAADVVPGDVLELGEGDVVPADGRLLEARALLVDESALTGESVPVDHDVAGEGGPGSGVDGGPGEDDGRLRAGTVVVRGRAVLEVTATGAASAMGRIAALLDTRRTLTPLQRRLVGLGRWIAGVGAVLCLAVLVQGVARGEPVELMLVTAVSLLVAAVPESLPAVVTLALALGARRMARRHAVVRHLPAVETLGSVTVVATDKTGTLTEGEMVVEALWTPDGEAEVTGRGYAPHGTVLVGGEAVTAADPGSGGSAGSGALGSTRAARAAVRLLRAAALCCDARLVAGDGGRWAVIGDPTEGALLAAAAKAGLTRDALEAEAPRVAELPFDSGRRRMTTVHRPAPGDLLVACKGAPDVLAPPLVRADTAVLAAARARAGRYAAAGYRVLAVAAGHRAGAGSAGPDGGWERDLDLLGLVAIADPPRPCAAATVAACRAAGVVPVLVTGDHVATARAVAVRVGIAAPDDPVVSSTDAPAGAVPGADVPGADVPGAPGPVGPRGFARTAPEQKLQLVRAWQRGGHVVAMTGDGVNDGPALHAADIGVAMGRRGTEVARQAADLVLADDDLATVVAAVEEGRRVYANVRRFLLYALAGGVAEILVMLAGPPLGLAVPLLPAQILWINLLTHGLPGVAFGAEPAAPDGMRRPPRPPAQSVLGDGLWQRIGRTGAVIAAVTLAAGAWAARAGEPVQSTVFLTLAGAQLAVALAVRARPGTWSNPALLVAVAGAAALQFAALTVPPLQDLLGTRLPGPGALLVAVLATVPGFVVARLDRIRADRRHARAAPAAAPPVPASPGGYAGAPPEER